MWVCQRAQKSKDGQEGFSTFTLLTPLAIAWHALKSRGDITLGLPFPGETVSQLKSNLIFLRGKKNGSKN